jgi:hypothetical protein
MSIGHQRVSLFLEGLAVLSGAVHPNRDGNVDSLAPPKRGSFGLRRGGTRLFLRRNPALTRELGVL